MSNNTLLFTRTLPALEFRVTKTDAQVMVQGFIERNLSQIISKVKDSEITNEISLAWLDPKTTIYLRSFVKSLPNKILTSVALLFYPDKDYYKLTSDLAASFLTSDPYCSGTRYLPEYVNVAVINFLLEDNFSKLLYYYLKDIQTEQEEKRNKEMQAKAEQKARQGSYDLAATIKMLEKQGYKVTLPLTA